MSNDSKTINIKTTYKRNAFEHYLMLQNPMDATNHLLECLQFGQGDSTAWDWMTKHFGTNWSSPPAELPKMILIKMIQLKMEFIRELQAESKTKAEES